MYSMISLSLRPKTCSTLYLPYNPGKLFYLLEFLSVLTYILFFSRFCTFKAKGQPLFVDGSEFYEPKHFGKIMGYDKPLDLRWDSTQNITQSEADARKRNKTKE